MTCSRTVKHRRGLVRRRDAELNGGNSISCFSFPSSPPRLFNAFHSSATTRAALPPPLSYYCDVGREADVQSTFSKHVPGFAFFFFFLSSPYNKTSVTQRRRDIFLTSNPKFGTFTLVPNVTNVLVNLQDDTPINMVYIYMVYIGLIVYILDCEKIITAEKIRWLLGSAIILDCICDDDQYPMCASCEKKKNCFPAWNIYKNIYIRTILEEVAPFYWWN